jgi:hypothetical protein
MHAVAAKSSAMEPALVIHELCSANQDLWCLLPINCYILLCFWLIFWRR